MEIILLYIYDISLGIYFGTSIFIGFIAAPVIFKTLDTKQKAGNLVGMLLEKFGIMTYIFQAVMFISSVFLFKRFGYSPVLLIIPAVIIIINAISGVGISRRMKILKKEMKDIDATPKTDKKRIKFNSLHKWSVKLFVLNQILALPLFYFIFR